MSQREVTASTSGAVDNVSARRNGRPLVSAPATAPDPEVVAKPTRRRLTAEYKLRIPLFGGVDAMKSLVVIIAIILGVAALVLRANADAIRRLISLWRWRRAYGRQRLRCDVSRLIKNNRVASGDAVCAVCQTRSEAKV